MHEMSKPDDYYSKAPMGRTLENLKQEKKKSEKNYCSIHKPLLKLHLDHIVADELHLLLRITDVLLRNVIMEVMEWDKEQQMTQKSKNKHEHLDKLVNIIKENI